ncbi:MAG: two-component regulator propeller domain-containing protein, partial [Ignavibacteriaceae bacterium]
MDKKSIIGLLFAGYFFLYPVKGDVFAQSFTFDAEYYTSLQGLSQHYIFAVLQDYKGFMWFGTKDGLNRFDGYSFKVYRNNPLDSASISDSYIMSLFEDKDSNLWIGTAGGGLNKFNRETETFTRYPNTIHDPVTKSYFHINALYRDDYGKIWIGTNGQGLHIFDPLSGTIQRLLNDSSGITDTPVQRIYKIYKDLEDRLWLATVEGGLILAENIHGRFKFKSFVPEKTRPGLEGININTLIQPRFNNDGSLWIGTNQGLMKFDPISGKFTDYNSEAGNNSKVTIRQIEETNDGNLWISCYDKLIKYNPAAGKFYIMENRYNPEINKLLGNAVRLYTDRSGILWIGTSGYGIMRYNPRTERFGKQNKNIRNYILDDLFKIPANVQKIVQPFFISPRTIIEETDSTLWISVDGKGILKYSLRENKIIKDYSPVCQPDFTLTEPVNIIGEKIAPYFGQIIKLTPENKKESELWIGTEKGVLRMNIITGICSYLRIYPKFQTADVQLNGTGNPDISAMLEDANGVVWLGTPTLGLVRVDPEDYSIHFFRHNAKNENSLSSDAILCIEQDPYNKNILWIGTEGGGLNKFDTSSKTFFRIHEANGFPNNVVYGILADRAKKLWISTNKGLVRYNTITSRFRLYDFNQGLQDNEFNRYEFFRSLDGKMYFGGINGCNVFDPNQLTDNEVVPSIVITDFKLFNKSISAKNEKSPLASGIVETKHIALNYSQNVVTFEFAALEFSSPSNNNYAYKLEGFDRRWIYSGHERTATYTNLDPGEYIFRVKASNNDDVWNESGSS